MKTASIIGLIIATTLSGCALKMPTWKASLAPVLAEKTEQQPQIATKNPPVPADPLPPPPVVTHMPVPTKMAGIYLAANTLVSKKGEFLVSELIKNGGNTIVVDVQAGSKLSYPSTLPLSLELGNVGKQVLDMRAAIEKLHQKNMYVVGRFVLFKSQFLAALKKEWTLKDKRTGKPFANREGAIWLDSGNPELIAYYADICRELAELGFDEIQFDYVRFPEAGKNGYIGYTYTGMENTTREQTIVNAVTTLGQALHDKGVKVSIDVFGIIVWDKVSGPIIGQNITALAPHVDAIYPMSYPSHFGPGWGGHKNPGDEPYFFNYETTKKFVEQTAGSGAQIRPWLQGFVYRTAKFDSEYVFQEIKAVTDLGLSQFVVWNAANNYPYVFKAFGRLDWQP